MNHDRLGRRRLEALPSARRRAIGGRRAQNRRVGKRVADWLRGPVLMDNAQLALMTNSERRRWKSLHALDSQREWRTASAPELCGRALVSAAAGRQCTLTLEGVNCSNRTDCNSPEASIHLMLFLEISIEYTAPYSRTRNPSSYGVGIAVGCAGGVAAYCDVYHRSSDVCIIQLLTPCQFATFNR